MNTAVQTTVNGIDTEFLKEAMCAIQADPSKGQTRWNVTTEWKGGTRSDTRVTNYQIGGQTVEKDYTIPIDEPLEIGGTNQYANPQEYLMAAMNACMMVGYVAVCALEGIELESVRIETEGDIDLRGFLGLSEDVKPGYDELRYRVHLKGDATPEQFMKVHEVVTATAPNRYNLATAIPLRSQLVVE